MMDTENPLKKPNFFIVGAPKCGTTAMYEYLRQHPDIFMPDEKEPNHFGNPATGMYNPYTDEVRYLSLFAAATEKRIGEATPTYLFFPPAAQRIHDFNPSAKIIIMLRSPVELLYSSYQHLRMVGREPAPSFEAAVLTSDEDRQTVSDGYWWRTQFAEPVQRYMDLFGRQNVLVIIFDDFRSDTASVFRQTLEFLGVDADFQTEFRVVNPAKEVRSGLLNNLLVRTGLTPLKVKRSRIGRLFARLIPAQVGTPVFNTVRRLYLREKRLAPMPPELRQKLQVAYLSDVQKLSQLLDRDLTHWCRD